MSKLYEFTKKLKQFIALVVICALITIPHIFGIGRGDGWCADSQGQLSSRKEKEKTVEQAIDLYHAGDRRVVMQRLEQVEPVLPENYAIPYYQGLIELEMGNRTAAISKWKRYVALDPHSENAMAMRKYLTLLVREQARENAGKAVARKAMSAKSPISRNAIAVATFENIGFTILGPLGKGISEMLISDLSNIPDLAVVSRTELQAVLKEMSLDTATPLDSDTALRAGKLLRVNHVITGRLQDSKTENLLIKSRIWKTIRKKPGDTHQAAGKLKQFFELEKEIACGIARSLGKKCDAMPPDFHTVHTRSMSALVAFSWGLDHLDHGRYDQARDMFQKALEKDTGFAMAERALLTTPTSVIAAKSISEMISDLSSKGKATMAAGNGTQKSRGISKTAYIGGGLAIAGGAAALAMNGGGGDTEPAPHEPAPQSSDLSGNWNGHITSGLGRDINLSINLTQSGTSLSGNATFLQWDCLSTVDFNGTLDTTWPICTFTLNLRTSALSVEISGTCGSSDIIASMDVLSSTTAACEEEADGAGVFLDKQ